MADHKAVKGGAIRALNGFDQEEDKRRAALLAQIPTTPDPSRTESTNPVVGTDFTRNVGNALSALPGASPALGAASAMARAVPVLGNALAATGSGIGALASRAAPYAAPVAGIGALSAASSPASTPVSTPAALAPVAPATTLAGDATLPGQDPGRSLSTASPDGRYSLSGVEGKDVGGAVQRYDVPGKSPLFTNLTGEAGRIDNAALMARGPISKQNQGALDGIQARQDINDARGASREQYDKEVAAATATNNWQARRTLEQAALGTPSFRGSNAIRPSKAAQIQLADLQQQETTRRGQDQQATQQGAIAKLAQDKFNQDATGTGLDNASKAGVLAAQKALAGAKTPAERLAAEDNLRALQGKYGKEPAPVRHLVVPGGQALDADGRAYTMPSRVFNPDTQQFIDQAPANPPAKGVNAPTSKVQYDALPKGAKYTHPDGTTRTKG